MAPTTQEQRLILSNESDNAGTFDGYTSSRRPVKLLWSQEFTDIRDAIEAERKLKEWTRFKKEALMRGNFELLHELSRSTYAKKKQEHP